MASMPMNKSSGEFERIFNENHGRILFFLRKYDHTRYGITTDDVLQEIKIRLWKVLEKGNGIQSFSAYLKKIVDSVIINNLRDVHREREAMHSVEFQSHLRDNGHDIGSDGDRDRLRGAVTNALDGLKESKRKVMYLSLSGYSIQEISGMFHWTRKKTYGLYERGLADLKKILAKEGIKHEDEPAAIKGTLFRA